jgi:hypothetical protein
MDSLSPGTKRTEPVGGAFGMAAKAENAEFTDSGANEQWQEQDCGEV